MNIVLEYRSPNTEYCTVAVFLNGVNTGSLCLRQEEVGSFQQILFGGCVNGIDTFLSKGISLPQGDQI